MDMNPDIVFGDSGLSGSEVSNSSGSYCCSDDQCDQPDACYENHTYSPRNPFLNHYSTPSPVEDVVGEDPDQDDVDDGSQVPAEVKDESHVDGDEVNEAVEAPVEGDKIVEAAEASVGDEEASKAYEADESRSG